MELQFFHYCKKEMNYLKNTTMYDFVLKVIPSDIKSELSVELIDEVFSICPHLPHSSSNIE